ncbi:MAG TPA: hypothetical protein VGH97_11895 [Thermoanaerobaculia bacterium]
MNGKLVRISLAAPLAAAALFLAPAAVPGQATTAPPPQAAGWARDGQHDFDFLYGSWKVRLKRLVKPLTGSTTWVEFGGSAHCQPVWGGKANLDTLEADDPNSKTHIQGLTLRIYNPASHQWSLYWANAKNGVLGLPATVGGFDGNGRGEFYDQEDYEGRMIFVRYVWSNITPTSAHFEQSFSADGGKTWEVNWIYDGTRVEE